MPEESRLGFLDFIRGIAAFAVLVQHTSETLWPSINWATHQYVNVGRFGVLAFFLVSGFIIPFSLERGASVRRFWIGRFFRLYPLYWVSLIAILAIYQFRPDALTPDFQTHTLLHAVVNFTMIQELVGIPHAIGLYYTLTVELVFYALCAVLFAFGLLRRSVRNAWVVLVGSVVLGTVAPFVLDHRAPMAGLFYVSSMFIGTVVFLSFILLLVVFRPVHVLGRGDRVVGRVPVLLRRVRDAPRAVPQAVPLARPDQLLALPHAPAPRGARGALDGAPGGPPLRDGREPRAGGIHLPVHRAAVPGARAPAPASGRTSRITWWEYREWWLRL